MVMMIGVSTKCRGDHLLARWLVHLPCSSPLVAAVHAAVQPFKAEIILEGVSVSLKVTLDCRLEVVASKVVCARDVERVCDGDEVRLSLCLECALVWSGCHCFLSAISRCGDYDE